MELLSPQRHFRQLAHGKRAGEQHGLCDVHVAGLDAVRLRTHARRLVGAIGIDVVSPEREPVRGRIDFLGCEPYRAGVEFVGPLVPKALGALVAGFPRKLFPGGGGRGQKKEDAARKQHGTKHGGVKLVLVILTHASIGRSCGPMLSETRNHFWFDWPRSSSMRIPSGTAAMVSFDSRGPDACQRLASLSTGISRTDRGLAGNRGRSRNDKSDLPAGMVRSTPLAGPAA